MADMRYRRLGNSGLVVSVVGLGCNNFGARLDGEKTTAVIDSALSHGINFFDTSDSYNVSEELMGESLRGRRDDVIVATKFGSDIKGGNGNDFGARGSRRYIKKAVERSLRRLQTDWIDLYQIHFPDNETPIEETLSALTDLVREGKVRYIGTSNHLGWQIANADWVARELGSERFISAQNRYNLLQKDVEKEIIPACMQFGVGFIPFSPLASGLLTGKVQRGEAPAPGTRLANKTQDLTDDKFDVVEKLAAFAKERGVSLLDVAIGGLAAKPGVSSVIAGASGPDQIAANVAAGMWEPSADDMAILNKI